MTRQAGKNPFGPIVSGIIIIAAAALLSGYLTFKVQFERRRPPRIQRPKAESMQTLRIREQERRQVHEHFHLLTEDPNLEAWANKSSCVVCHSPYPHGRTTKAVAIMNLHTEFMTCHACHLKLDAHREIRFGWITPTGAPSQGKPYGVAIDPDTGLFAETGDHVSKLAPHVFRQGRWEPITASEGIAAAIDYMQHSAQYPSERKSTITDRLHAGTELRAFIKCSQCHSKTGIMDFRALGFEPARANQLEKMEIGGMLTNYDIFYFPDLFESEFH